MIKITENFFINEEHIELSFFRSPGPGGQHVNKTASAVLLRLNIHSAIKDVDIKNRLLAIAENKINQEGYLLIKAFRHRTQEQNKKDAIERLKQILTRAAFLPKKRKKIKVSLAAKEKKQTQKKLHSQKKSLRKRDIHRE